MHKELICEVCLTKKFLGQDHEFLGLESVPIPPNKKNEVSDQDSAIFHGMTSQQTDLPCTNCLQSWSSAEYVPLSSLKVLMVQLNRF